jgi:hypothetical protein
LGEERHRSETRLALAPIGMENAETKDADFSNREPLNL